MTPQQPPTREDQDNSAVFEYSGHRAPPPATSYMAPRSLAASLAAMPSGPGLHASGQLSSCSILPRHASSANPSSSHPSTSLTQFFPVVQKPSMEPQSVQFVLMAALTMQPAGSLGMQSMKAAASVPQWSSGGPSPMSEPNLRFATTPARSASTAGAASIDTTAATGAKTFIADEFGQGATEQKRGAEGVPAGGDLCARCN